jgi:hypothetical protein
VITTHWTWQGTDDFLGSANRTRGRKEKPMQYADTQKGLFAYWILTLQKKNIFAMDRCFLLTGAF